MTDKTVFLSYSRRDRDFAKALYARLKGEGFDLWRDVHDIDAGADDWWEAIKEGIERCDTLILCMSLPALKSPVVSDEWFYARTLGRRIIPVVADDIWEHPEVKSGEFTIPNWMQRRNWIDFRPHVPEADAVWANLIRTLSSDYTPKKFVSMVPELPQRFVRRPADADRTIRALVDDANDAVAMTTALRAAGGYGKTTLAKAIARDLRIQGAFDDGILWVTLGEELLKKQGDDLRGALIGRVLELIYALNGQRPVIETLDMAYAELTKAVGEAYILLVIDDVWDAAHLNPFLLKCKHTACLITTRNADTLPEKGVQQQTVDKMLPVEAVELLSAGFDPETVKPHLAALTTFARDLREYPLLLALANTQIANLVNDLKLSLDEAIALAIDTLREKGVLGFDDTDTDDRTRAVSSTLDVSLAQLRPDEQTRFLQLTIFPEDALIPLTTLEKYWGIGKIDTLKFCQKLYRKTALLHSFEGLQIRIHDVFRDYLIRQHTTDELQLLHTRLLDGYGDLYALPDSYAWINIAYHLFGAIRAADLRRMLLDYRWLQAKLNAADVNALIADCDAALSPEGLAQCREQLGADEDGEAIRLLRSALTLSAHILSADKSALAHQLSGRLWAHRETPGIADLYPTITPPPNSLYPLHPAPTHTQAGGALLRTLAGHSGVVRSVAFSADGTRLASASSDSTVKLWDVARGTEVATLSGHSDWVRSVAFSADGTRLASASDDSTVKLWDVATGACIATFYGDNAFTTLAWSPDGSHIVAGDNAGRVLFLRWVE